jgi:hypothetical protein
LNWWKDIIYLKKKSIGIDTIAEHQVEKVAKLIEEYSINEPNTENTASVRKSEPSTTQTPEFCVYPAMLPYSVALLNGDVLESYANIADSSSYKLTFQCSPDM